MNWIFFFFPLGILLWFTALLYLRFYVKRRTAPEYILSSLGEEVRLLEAAIDEKTERDLQLLEERIRVLRQLLDEAERRIAVYVREMDRRKAGDEALLALGRQAPNSGGGKPAAVPRQAAAAGQRPKKASSKGKKSRLIDSIEIRELNLAQANSAYRAQLSVPAASSAAPPVPVPSAIAAVAAAAAAIDADAEEAPRFSRSETPVLVPKPPSLRERVAELYNAGFSEDLIASRLEISVDAARLYMGSFRPGGKKPPAKDRA